MTTISSGTLATSGTTTYIVGTSSGLDTSALVEVAVASKTIAADRIDLEVEENDLKISAYEEMQTLAATLGSSLDNLKSIVGFANQDTNIFSARAGYMESSTSTEATSLISVAVDTDAAIGDYEIVVNQKAFAQKVMSGSQTTSTDPLDGTGYTGTFDIGLAGGATETISVTAGMSLTDLANEINNFSETSGVTASVVKIGENQFTLVLTGQETNKAIEISNVTGDDVMTSIGVTDSLGGAYSNVLQNAQAAQITLDGITITRDDNNFDDVLEGIDISVENADPGTTISLSIGNDTSSTKEAITAFVDAYNDLREFIVTNQTVTDDGAVSSALFSDTIMESMNSAIANIIGSATNSSLATLRDIGITYTNDNYLSIDSTALDDALLDNYDAVEELFATTYQSSTDQFALTRNESSADFPPLSFDITVDGSGNMTNVLVNGEANMFDISGTRLVGKEGTIYAGLSFSYQAGVSDTITYNLNQGIGDRLSNALSAYTDSLNGIISSSIAALEEENTDLTAESATIRSNAEDYRTRLIEKYAAMEAQIEALKLIQQQLQAIIGNNDDDN